MIEITWKRGDEVQRYAFEGATKAVAWMIRCHVPQTVRNSVRLTGHGEYRGVEMTWRKI